MKRLLPALGLIVILCSCSSNIEQRMPPVQKLEQLQQGQPQEIAQITVINSHTSIPKGGNGSITIQGMPNTLYTITASYNISGKPMSTSISQMSDSTGRATWNWISDHKTDAGTYPVTIYGGGRTVTISYNVY